MATTADFRNGLCITYQGDLCTILSFQHVKPGKGGAFVRTELKSLHTGKVVERTFPAGVKINIVRVEHRSAQFLYQDPAGYHFMNQHTFDTHVLQKESIGVPNLLKEGQEVQLIFDTATETILSCELPSAVSLTVTYTEPSVKGDTATRALKRATLETGAMVQVPLFIQIGDLLKINTRTGNYLERITKA